MYVVNKDDIPEPFVNFSEYKFLHNQVFTVIDGKAKYLGDDIMPYDYSYSIEGNESILATLLNGRIAYQGVDITGERKELYFSKLGMYSDIQKAIGAYRGIQCLYTKKVELKNHINTSHTNFIVKNTILT